jgi:hypothetical protein
LVPNTAHILQFTQCVLWSRTYTKYLQLLIVRPQYSAERICAAIGDITTIHVRYTANLVPNTAHILRFTLYELCFRTYTMHFQIHIFRLQYSIERICAAIRDNLTLRCPLYYKFGAKYSGHHPV